jgi:hypothetical protein
MVQQIFYIRFSNSIIEGVGRWVCLNTHSGHPSPFSDTRPAT